MERISKESLQRLPSYVRLLKELRSRGEVNVSSTAIADSLSLNPVQVRKDLATVSSVAGKPKLGFNVAELCEDMERFLGYNDATQAVLVGAGKLGKALLGYTNFNNYGIKIVLAFDLDPSIDEVAGNNVPILAVKQLPELVRRMEIHIGIITVPKDNAQEICDLMVGAGIRAIWNFAPVNLTVPPTVTVKNEDMAASLAVLSHNLAAMLEKE